MKELLLYILCVFVGVANTINRNTSPLRMVVIILFWCCTIYGILLLADL